MNTLVDTIATLRQYVPINYSFTPELMEPHLRRAERTYLVPVLGEEFLAELRDHDQGSSSSTSAVLDTAVELAQEALSHLAVRLALPYLSVQVGDAGLHITQTENYRPPYQWQVGDLAAGLHESGMAALEALYAHLERHIGAPAVATWAASSARSVVNGVLIPSATEFDRYYRIGASRITYVDLVPAMRRATDLHLRPQLGTAFVDALLAHLNSEDSSSTAGDTAMDTALEKVQAALAPLAVAEAKEVMFRYVNGGLTSTRMEPNRAQNEKNVGPDVVQAQRRAALEVGVGLLALAHAWCDANADSLTGYTARTSADSLPVVEDRLHNTGGMLAM